MTLKALPISKNALWILSAGWLKTFSVAWQKSQVCVVWLPPTSERERKERRKRGRRSLRSKCNNSKFKSSNISFFWQSVPGGDVFVTKFKRAGKTQTRTNSYWTATRSNLSQTSAPTQSHHLTRSQPQPPQSRACGVCRSIPPPKSAPHCERHELLLVLIPSYLAPDLLLLSLSHSRRPHI